MNNNTFKLDSFKFTIKLNKNDKLVNTIKNHHMASCLFNNIFVKRMDKKLKYNRFAKNTNWIDYIKISKYRIQITNPIFMAYKETYDKEFIYLTFNFFNLSLQEQFKIKSHKHNVTSEMKDSYNDLYSEEKNISRVTVLKEYLHILHHYKLLENTTIKRINFKLQKYDDINTDNIRLIKFFTKKNGIFYNCYKPDNNEVFKTSNDEESNYFSIEKRIHTNNKNDQYHHYQSSRHRHKNLKIQKEDNYVFKVCMNNWETQNKEVLKKYNIEKKKYKYTFASDFNDIYNNIEQFIKKFILIKIKNQSIKEQIDTFSLDINTEKKFNDMVSKTNTITQYSIDIKEILKSLLVFE